ncbi:hypothetical protein Terro_4252 [Terriglobus roseus DSM 18391]|uniref:DUF2147 domain-containing protein n=1 Tax=Terriglobus roseus (strain DSM 18391 / NRRL B-41598 / KBS 63) TaxID=926566 RepID=I3ZMI8_TERRK|nr:DUF2147 domain-containing protein [Terriglobus roseus]AFL90456.1 hypothetical protein Terro_4252 [Terriglobus roseus DSM 18391]
MRVFGAASLLLMCGFLQLSTNVVRAQQNGILGYWKEPGGSVIHVATCGKDVCATLAAISPTAPGRVDNNNPDAGLRTRSLCGLRLGEGFQMVNPTKAEDGKLYDPKSGRTYNGRMESHGDVLSLRGYVGISLLGRTEKWNRTSETAVCKQ